MTSVKIFIVNFMKLNENLTGYLFLEQPYFMLLW